MITKIALRKLNKNRLWGYPCSNERWTFNVLSDVQSLLAADYITNNLAPGSRPLEPGASIDRNTAIHTNVDIIAYVKNAPDLWRGDPGQRRAPLRRYTHLDYSTREKAGNDEQTSSNLYQSIN